MNLNRIVKEETPKVFPPGWELLRPGLLYKITLDKIAVIYSISTLEDGKRYHHVSLSRQGSIPGWQEMTRLIRSLPWFDNDREIFMTLPREEDYVNLCTFAMHWWQEIENGQ